MDYIGDDVMKKLIIFFGLLGSVAWGQNMQEQKACYDQAAKVVNKNIQSFNNHYDARTKTSWVEEFNNDAPPNKSPTYTRIVYNAFEHQGTDASFIGELGKKPVFCWVGDKECRSINEFDMLVSQRYGLKLGVEVYLGLGISQRRGELLHAVGGAPFCKLKREILGVVGGTHPSQSILEKWGGTSNDTLKPKAESAKFG